LLILYPKTKSAKAITALASKIMKEKEKNLKLL